MDVFLRADNAVLRDLLVRNATTAPGEALVHLEDGSTWTHLDALRYAAGAARELRAAGVRQGDAVAVGLGNSGAFLRAWWGAAVLGAVLVPVNPTHRGPLLRRLLDLSRPTAVVSDGELAQRIQAESGHRDFVLLTPVDVARADRVLPDLERPLEAWDTHGLILTSGTTGPSKLVRTTYAQHAQAGAATLDSWAFGPDDTYLCDLPLYHVAAINTTFHMIRSRSRIALRSRPQLNAYWEVARDTQATYAHIYSTVMAYLQAQPPRGAEHEHRLRLVSMIPLPADVESFRRRFGIGHISTSWGSTEAAGAVIGPDSAELPPRSCGRIRPGWHVRLVDAFDSEVPEGTAGEAIVRCDSPWMIAAEYVGAPSATAAAWRNGWFHTGDLLRRDDEGVYYFVDRLKDSLRRRGQNVSSYEVETVIQAYPGVLEVAVVPERSDAAAEDEVKAWIVVEHQAAIDFGDLLRYCASNLPHYMVPRYFELAVTFDKTPTGKIRKEVLVQRGSAHSTWDRRAHGIEVTRRGVERFEEEVP